MRAVQAKAKGRKVKCKKQDSVSVKDFALEIYRLILEEFPNLKERPSQTQLISEMGEAMDCGDEISIASAPVGTGKSLCILILVYASWYLYNKKSLISTGTILLQEQLIKKIFQRLRVI